MKATTRNDYLDRIRRVLPFVQEHMDEPLTPQRLALLTHICLPLVPVLQRV